MSDASSFARALAELAGHDASLVHPTYGYLERRIRIAGLTIVQWVGLAMSLLAAYLLSSILPLPSPYDLSVGLALCGIPTAWTLVATDGEIDLHGHALGWWRWRQLRAVYVPDGPRGEPASPIGLTVVDEPAPIDRAGATS